MDGEKADGEEAEKDIADKEAGKILLMKRSMDRLLAEIRMDGKDRLLVNTPTEKVGKENKPKHVRHTQHTITIYYLLCRPKLLHTFKRKGSKVFQRKF